MKTATPKKRTSKTKTGLRELLHEIRKVRKCGYALNDEEQELGVRSIAVPVAAPQLQMSLAMAVSVHAGRMSVAEMIRHILPKLQAGKLSLEKVL